MKFGNLNFLERSGPFQAYNGTALPFTFNFSKLKYYAPDDGDWTETCRICFNVNFNILLKQLYCTSGYNF